MKLYATVTSERASKGQGGNKSLEVVFQAGSGRDIIGKAILFAPVEGNERYMLVYENPNGETQELWSFKDKGKRQKGEELETEYKTIRHD